MSYQVMSLVLKSGKESMERETVGREFQSWEQIDGRRSEQAEVKTRMVIYEYV